MLRYRPNPGAGLRLFCFPSAGSGVSSLHAWFKGLSPDYELCPVQLPGREDRRWETPFRRMAPLVATAADALEARIDLPYAVFGHSLGALIAFEVALELRRRDLPPPIRLLASSRIAPQLRSPHDPIHLLPDAEFIAQLSSRYGAIPAVILADPELLGLFLPVLRADIEVLETYVYCSEPPLDVPISVLSGTGDPMIDAIGVAAWAERSSLPITSHSFCGDHFFPRTAADKFVQAISNDLAKSLSGATPPPNAAVLNG